ncbi:MAG TPA: hypothetical protein PKE62_08025 [Anaerolineales bacterium]|nr:hypothetical protein [Anaerolineales bacterium]
MDNELQKAIQLVKEGNKIDGGRILAKLVKAEPNNEQAWLWLSTCVVPSEQKYFCLNKVLAINPNNSNALKALAQLDAQKVHRDTTELSEPQSDKMKIVSEIGNLESQLARYESNLRAKMDEFSVVKPNYTSGTFLFLVGVILVFIGFDIGILLIVLSLLAVGMAALRSAGKPKKVKKEIEAIENKIGFTRGKLAELRAKLMIL